MSYYLKFGGRKIDREVKRVYERDSPTYKDQQQNKSADFLPLNTKHSPRLCPVSVTKDVPRSTIAFLIAVSFAVAERF